MKYLLITTIVFLNFVYNFGLPLIEGTGDPNVSRPADPVPIQELTIPQSENALNDSLSGDDPGIEGEQHLLNQLPIVVIIERERDRGGYDSSRRPWGFSGSSSSSRDKSGSSVGNNNRADDQDYDSDPEGGSNRVTIIGHGHWDRRWVTHGRRPSNNNKNQRKKNNNNGHRDVDEQGDYDSQYNEDNDEDGQYEGTRNDRPTQSQQSGNRKRMTSQRRNNGNNKNSSNGIRRNSGNRNRIDEQDEELTEKADGRGSDQMEQGSTGEDNPMQDPNSKGSAFANKDSTIGSDQVIESGTHGHWDKLWQSHGQRAQIPAPAAAGNAGSDYQPDETRITGPRI